VGAGSGPVSDIVWDGVLALEVPGQCPAAPPAMAPANNCFQANGAATYTNVNLCGDLAADQMQLDDVDCSYPSLSTQDP
jgi:hypothetical protein